MSSRYFASTHAGNCFASLRVSNPYIESHFLEAFAFDIAKEGVGHVVVGDKNVSKTIAIEVIECDAHSFRQHFGDTGFF